MTMSSIHIARKHDAYPAYCTPLRATVQYIAADEGIQAECIKQVLTDIYSKNN